MLKQGFRFYLERSSSVLSNSVLQSLLCVVESLISSARCFNTFGVYYAFILFAANISSASSDCCCFNVCRLDIFSSAPRNSCSACNSSVYQNACANLLLFMYCSQDTSSVSLSSSAR